MNLPRLEVGYHLAYPEKVAGFVFTQKEACMRCLLPSIGDVAGHAAPSGVLQYDGQMLFCKDCLSGTDDTDMPLTQLRLDLHMKVGDLAHYSNPTRPPYHFNYLKS